MSQSKDDTHDEQHVERILGHLSYFLTKNPDQKQQLDFEILLLAICWHDTWKSTRNPNTLMTFLFDNYWDGYGSYFTFLKESKNSGVNPKTRKRVAYAIRKHGFAEPFPRRTNEAKLLKDIDVLEKWNIERFDKTRKEWFSEPGTKGRLLMLKFAKKIFYDSQRDNHFYHKWFEQEYNKRKKTAIDFLNKTINDYSDYCNK
ncbi:MAG: hypothetical protein ABIH21_00320 [Patescibacteria group bacterium]